MKRIIICALTFLLCSLLLAGCSGFKITEIDDSYGSLPDSWYQTESSKDSSEADYSYTETDLSEIAGDTQSSQESGSSGSTSSRTDLESGSLSVSEDGEYTGRDEVALYIHLYQHLPSNYITKAEAKKLGWNSSNGNLDEVAPGKSIGGSRYSNYEGTLPSGSYKECDIDYHGGYRGSKRIIFSTDGRIYYTSDHYKTFTQLY